MRAEFNGLEAATTFKLRSRRIASQFGHDPRSLYVERFWLPILGPSTTWLIRYFAGQLELRGEGVELDVADTARALGLGDRPGRHAPFFRSIRRAADFDILIMNVLPAPSDPTATSVVAPPRLVEVAIRRSLAPLSKRLVERLPTALRDEHLGTATPLGADDGASQRARRLALTLTALGEGEGEVAAQLISWQVEPRLAVAAARAATEAAPSTPNAPGGTTLSPVRS